MEITLRGIAHHPNLSQPTLLGTLTQASERYHLTVSWPKTDTATLNASLDVEIHKKWQKRPKNLKVPLKCGDACGWDEFKGRDYALFRSKNQPQVIDATGQPTTVSSGDEVEIVFNVFPYSPSETGPKTEGISFHVVRVTKTGNRINFAPGGMVLYHNLPVDLIGLQRWMLWRFNSDNMKVPVDAATGGYCSSTDPATWRSLTLAQQEHAMGRYAGVGFSLTDAGYVGVDLDKCRDPQTGIVEQWAVDVVNHLQTYTEVSPSGTGLKLLLKGKLDGDYKCKSRVNGVKLEIYQSRRYFTLTGQSVHYPALPIAPVGMQLELIAEQYLPKVDDLEKERLATILNRLASMPIDDLMKPSARIIKARSALDSVQFDHETENDGSMRLLKYCKLCKQWGLDAQQTIDVIRNYATGQKAFNYPWSDAQIAQRHHDADCILGEAIVEGDGIKRTLSEELPEEVAAIFVNKNSFAGHPIYRYWRSCWYKWEGHRFKECDEFDANLTQWLQQHYTDIIGRCISDVLRNVKAMLQISGDRSPVWTIEHTWNPKHVFVTKNKMVNLDTGETLDNTPAFFTLAAAEYFYNADAPPPVYWFQFLQDLQIAITDIAVIQQWFGYCLSRDTSHEKMLALLGRSRSGKSTIANTLEKLIGEDSCHGTNLTSFGGQFGAEALVGKALAIFGDSSTPQSRGWDSGLATERIKAITGQDRIPINRKGIKEFSAGLDIKLMFVSNTLPEFHDPSGVVAGRMLPVRLHKSFAGHEDTEMKNKIETELPSILLWAMTGYRTLAMLTRFTESTAMKTTQSAIQQSMSPVREFFNERIVYVDGPHVDDESSYQHELYEAFKNYAVENGLVDRNSRTISSQRFRSEICDHSSRPLISKKHGKDGNRKLVGIRLRRPEDPD